jgi:hypothetical protein
MTHPSRLKRNHHAIPQPSENRDVDKPSGSRATTLPPTEARTRQVTRQSKPQQAQKKQQQANTSIPKTGPSQSTQEQTQDATFGQSLEPYKTATEEQTTVTEPAP